MANRILVREKPSQKAQAPAISRVVEPEFALGLVVKEAESPYLDKVQELPMLDEGLATILPIDFEGWGRPKVGEGWP